MTGWLEISGATNEVEVIAKFGDYGLSAKHKMEIEDLPSDSRYKIDLKEHKREFSIKNAIMLTHAAYTELMEILDDDENITIRARRNAGGDYMTLYDDNTSIVVACLAYANAKQMDFAGERWKIPKMTFRQSD